MQTLYPMTQSRQSPSAGALTPDGIPYNTARRATSSQRAPRGTTIAVRNLSAGNIGVRVSF